MDLDDEELFYTRLLNGKASIKEIEEYIKKLKRQINIKNEYLELIYDLGYDYDGCNTIKSLKQLIDELVDYAVKGYKNDDKSEIYMGGKNILCEKVGVNMEEDIKILEDMRDNIYGAIQFEDDYEVRALEQKQFDALNLAINHLRKTKLVHSQFIPKSLVKEKIEELEKKMEEDEVDEFGIHTIGWGYLDNVVEMLQKLLEE